MSNVIKRIMLMELYFELIKKLSVKAPDIVNADPDVNYQLDCLIHYYKCGQWLSDYELDEKGLLPASLKRGVLSQDGLYNLLTLLKPNIKSQ